MPEARDPGYSTRMEQTSRVENVLLVLEGGHAAAWVAADLHRWLPPEQVRLTLVQAVRELTDSGLFLQDSQNYIETLVRRQNEVQQENSRLIEQLTRDRYDIRQGSMNVATDEGGRQILHDLKELDADLLVVATPPKAVDEHPASGFAMQLVTHAPTPVLLLRRPLNSSYTRPLKVILATDDTDASAKAARRLPQLLRPESMSVTLVTVQNPYYLENAMLAPYVNTEAIDEAFEDNARMILNIARDLLETGDVQVEHAYRISGSPSRALMETFEKEEPDLVVVGSHNRTGLPAWLLGSVSHRLVQSDNHNILVVR